MSFAYVPQGFFPSSTRAQFVVDYTLPEGTDVANTTQNIAAIERWIGSIEGVTGTNTAIGGGHLRFMLTYSAESSNPAYGQILVDVDDYQRIEPVLIQIQQHINANYPDSLSKVWKFVLGPGAIAGRRKFD